MTYNYLIKYCFFSIFCRNKPRGTQHQLLRTPTSWAPPTGPATLAGAYTDDITQKISKSQQRSGALDQSKKAALKVSY